MKSLTRDEAASVAKRALFTSASIFCAAALVVAIAAAPADAKKRRKAVAPKVEEAIPDPQNGEPMTLVVSLGHQKVDVYRGTTLITSSQVSTGMPGHATKAGVFSILEKQRYHHSNIYSGAPMPWMNRITWSGTALHAGVVPGYPASHGCIRLLYSFAPKLFQITTVGDTVVVARDRVAPKLIEHPGLFQPLPPPAPPVMVKQEPPERQSRNDIEPAPTVATSHPLVLARADIASVTTDIPSELEVPAVEQGHAAIPSLAPADGDHARLAPAAASHPAPELQAVAEEWASAGDDTRVHAIDPGASSFDDGAGHAIAVVPSSADEHAVLGTSSGGPDDHALGESSAALSDPAIPGATPVVAASPEAAVIPVAATTSEPTLAPPAAIAEPQAAPAPAAFAASTGLATLVAAASANAALSAPAAASEPVAAPSAASEPAAPTEVIIPPVPSAKPSVIVAKLEAGAAAAGIEAAEPRSNAPLRILVTRGTRQDRIVDAQYVLSSMGYLEPQNFDGTLGRQTVNAIKAFQKANDLPPSGTFDDAFVKKLYAVAGKNEPPAGHIFVRQEFSRVFDAPVNLRNPDQPLGTYVFTAMKFAPGDTKTTWMAIDVQGDDPAAALDRLEIPDAIRQKISERLTPGSSLIIADLAINSASLPKGADFLVWAKDLPAKVTAASLSSGATDSPPKKKRNRSGHRKNNSGYTYNRSYPKVYPRWPW